MKQEEFDITESVTQTKGKLPYHVTLLATVKGEKEPKYRSDTVAYPNEEAYQKAKEMLHGFFRKDIETGNITS